MGHQVWLQTLSRRQTTLLQSRDTHNTPSEPPLTALTQLELPPDLGSPA